MLEQEIGGAPVTRRRDAADAQGDRNRPRARLDRRMARLIEEALRRDHHLLAIAIVEHQREFGAGVAAERIRPAHRAAQPFRGPRDHFVGDVVAVGAIEDEQVFEAREQNAEMRLLARRARQMSRDDVENMRAIVAIGQRVETRSELEFAFSLVVTGDNADQTVCASRLAIRAGEPAARILQPDNLICPAAADRDAVARAIGDARAAVRRG